MALTQRERLTQLEAQQEGHAREHELLDRMWTARLEAIDARLAGIDQVLHTWRLNGNGSNGERGRRGVSRRDMGVFSGTVALMSAAWAVVELLRAVGG